MSSQNEVVSIPYFVHEGEVARMERVNKRLVAALILVVVLMFVSNTVLMCTRVGCSCSSCEYTNYTTAGAGSYEAEYEAEAQEVVMES